MNKKTKFSIRVFSQTFLSCMFFMVQGKFLLITLGHVAVAAQVGAICTAAFILINRFSLVLLENKWYLAGFVFTATFIADYISHPTHFGEHYTEALYTAAGAALISLFISFTIFEKYFQK